MLSTTIDKYCYISCRRLPPFFKHKHRIVYSVIENVQNNDEIVHPAVRNVFNWANVSEGIEIHHDGDLPARSGLGSSSSFTVGMIHALAAMRGKMSNQASLARDAIHVEQNVIKENVGSQDQVAVAYGGFNRINFHKNDAFDVSPMIFPDGKKIELQSHLMLFFTGISRIASEIAKSQIENLKSREVELKHIQSMVDEGINILCGNSSIIEFGELLDESWKYKKALSDQISTVEIDEIYEAAQNAGAIGGKILGAGAGGFLLLFAAPEKQEKIRKKLKNLVHVPFKFDESGSRVIVYQPDGY